MTRALTAILASVAAMALGACTLFSKPTAHPSTQQPASQQPAQPSGSTAPQATASIQPPKPLKPGISFDPNRLIGLNYDEATSLAGKPADTRDEPPASIWRYKVEECFIDVYFYMDMGTQTFRALAYEVKPTKATPEIRKSCAEMARATPAKK